MEYSISNEVENELQAVSRGLTHLIFRNLRLVEEIHAKHLPLDDEVIKALNTEINNRIYTLLSNWLYGSEQEVKELLKTIEFSSLYGRGSWDVARKVEL